MQHDDVIWEVIRNTFCAFKCKLQKNDFCRNANSVTGLCDRKSCPLANSNYATVREHRGVCFLYIKTIERAHMPRRMWEKVRLSDDYMEALKQIDKLLKYWPHYMVHRCKQRLTKITQYLIRSRKLSRKITRELVRVHKKTERQEASRMKKAEIAAQLDNQIKKELYNRLLKGTYPEMENITKLFNKVLDEHAVPEEETVARQTFEVEDESEPEVEAEVDGELSEEEERELELEYETDMAAPPPTKMRSAARRSNDIEDFGKFSEDFNDDDDDDEGEEEVAPPSSKRPRLQMKTAQRKPVMPETTTTTTTTTKPTTTTTTTPTTTTTTTSTSSSKEKATPKHVKEIAEPAKPVRRKPWIKIEFEPGPEGSTSTTTKSTPDQSQT